MNCSRNLVKIKIDKTKYNKLTKMVGNNKKATISLKWKPKISLELGLKNTIEWLRLNKNLNKSL